MLTAPACGGGHASAPASASASADVQAKVAVAQGFVQKARETGDPTYYTKVAGLLPKHSKDPQVLITLGSLELARHQFRQARELGQQAVAVAPSTEAAYGVLIDADNELGRYDDALAATQKMLDLRPNLSSLSRASYARELRGDVPGAIELMTQAVTAGGGAGGENVAYVQTLLGNLLLQTGDVDGATRSYAGALVSFPGFAAARAGQARVLVAQGRYGEAADLLAEVVKVQPLAEYAIAQGDALTAAGRKSEAASAYALVDVIGRLYAANGVNVDLELALFAADHSPGSAAVKRARQALADRPSILGHDVLAWNLFRAGKAAEAAEAAKESALALRLGSRDPLLRYHAAAIAFARGDRTKAIEHLRVVLEGNPHFSAWLAPDVERLRTALSP
jgi:tetratricopeptide (TPR) repeat protein